MDIFRTQLTPTKHQRQQLKENCLLDSPRVTECAKEIVKLTPVKNTNKRKLKFDETANR